LAIGTILRSKPGVLNLGTCIPRGTFPYLKGYI